MKAGKQISGSLLTDICFHDFIYGDSRSERQRAGMADYPGLTRKTPKKSHFSQKNERI